MCPGQTDRAGQKWEYVWGRAGRDGVPWAGRSSLELWGGCHTFSSLGVTALGVYISLQTLVCWLERADLGDFIQNVIIWIKEKSLSCVWESAGAGGMRWRLWAEQEEECGSELTHTHFFQQSLRILKLPIMEENCTGAGS